MPRGRKKTVAKKAGRKTGVARAGRKGSAVKRKTTARKSA